MPVAVRTCVSCANFSQVGEAGLEVAAGLDAAEVNVVAVRPYDILAFAERLVGDHVDRGADRPDRAAVRSEGGADLLRLCRPEGLAQHLEQLHLVEAVVTTDQRE